MGAAPAYSYYPERAPQRAPQRTPERRPRIDVVPGGRTQTQSQALPAGVLTAARIVAVALVLVAALACCRIALSAATIEAAVASEELSSDIEQARSEGTTLEVSESVLASPSRVKSEAAALGMAETTATETVVLSADVVACDSDGNLSLSLSVAQAAALSE